VQPYTCIKDGAFGRCDCYDNATGTKIWSNWDPGPWAGQPAPRGAPYGCGFGASARNACQTQAAAIVRPLQSLLGWAPPERPQRPPLGFAPRRRFEIRSTQPFYRAPLPGEQPEKPPYVLPPQQTYTCVKDGSNGRVDCRDNTTGDRIWSNWVHGAWQNEPAPPGAPAGAGFGA